MNADSSLGRYFCMCEIWDVTIAHVVLFMILVKVWPVLNYGLHSGMKCRSSICKNVYILLWCGETRWGVCVYVCDELVMCWGRPCSSVSYHGVYEPMVCMIHGVYVPKVCLIHGIYDPCVWSHGVYDPMGYIINPWDVFVKQALRSSDQKSRDNQNISKLDIYHLLLFIFYHWFLQFRIYFNLFI